MQQLKHFDRLWDEAIQPSIQFSIEQMDDNFIEFASVKSVDLDSYKIDLKRVYKKKREWLKRSYLPHNPEPYLDFHKLGAVVCRSIIGLKPIKYDLVLVKELIKHQDFSQSTHFEQIDWFIRNVYVNYRIAFLSAVGLVYANLVHWAITKKGNCTTEDLAKVYDEFIHELTQQGRLSSYPEPELHENFENSTIIALMKNDLLQRDFDYLSFATILYQWEFHTKLKIFQKVLDNSKYSLSDIDLS